MATPQAPTKRFVGVDAELTAFEDNLWSGLEFLLIVNLNRVFWEEFDEIHEEIFHNISTVVDEASTDLRNQYNGTEVIPILDQISSEVKMMIRVGMDVPFPRDPDFHTDRVICNTNREVMRKIHGALRDAMLQVNHNAHILQRTWRKVITDPRHPACIRRLDFEFEDAMRTLHETLSVRVA